MANRGSRTNRTGNERNDRDRNDGSDVESDEVSDSEEDARAFEEAERFEQKYNFRFEEPDGGGFRATREPSKAQCARKRPADETRASRAERAQAQRERAAPRGGTASEEPQAQEICAKMSQIAAVGGLAGAEAVAAADLNAEFDPEQHDRAMAAMYGEQYYGGALLDEEGEELEKPEFGDLDEEVNAVIGAATEEEGGAADDSEKFKRLRAWRCSRDQRTAPSKATEGTTSTTTTTTKMTTTTEGWSTPASKTKTTTRRPANGAAVRRERFGREQVQQTRGEALEERTLGEDGRVLRVMPRTSSTTCRVGSSTRKLRPRCTVCPSKEMLSMSTSSARIVPLKKLAPYRHDADATTAPKERGALAAHGARVPGGGGEARRRQAGRARGGKKMLARERKGKKDLDKELAADTADPAAAAAAAAMTARRRKARAPGASTTSTRKARRRTLRRPKDSIRNARLSDRALPSRRRQSPGRAKTPLQTSRNAKNETSWKRRKPRGCCDDL